MGFLKTHFIPTNIYSSIFLKEWLFLNLRNGHSHENGYFNA
jgi:hypothetical protein